MQEIAVRTRRRSEMINITAEVQRALDREKTASGLCAVFVPHTTAAVTINENADPSVQADILGALDRVVPADAAYAHSEGNSDAHAKACLVGSSVTVPVEGGRLCLGTWQGIFFCEFDGPRERRIWIQIPLNDGAPDETPSPGCQFIHFLKTQAFYLALVILVVAMAGPRVAGSLHDALIVLGLKPQTAAPAASEPGPPALLQKDLAAAERSWVQADARSDPAVVRFAADVERFNGFLAWAGLAALLALGIWWALLPAYPPSETSQPPSEAAAGPPGNPASPQAHPVWDLWDVAKLAALFVIGSWLLHAIFGFDRLRPFASRGDWMAEIFARILLVGVLFHIVVSERGGRLRDLGIRGRFFANAFIGLLAFLAVQPILSLAGQLVERWFPDATVQEALQAMLSTRSAWVLWLATVLAVVIAPIAEELFFRSFLQPALQASLGRWAGICLTAAFFAAAHMDLYALVPLLVLGFALGCVYDRTRSLVAPAVLHAAYNGLALLSLFADRGLMHAATRMLR